MKAGWYRSPVGRVHFVEGDKYFCNKKVARPINMIPYTSDKLVSNDNICKICTARYRKIKMTKPVTTRLDDKTLEALEELRKYWGLADRSKTIRFCIMNEYRLPPLIRNIEFDEPEKVLPE